MWKDISKKKRNSNFWSNSLNVFEVGLYEVLIHIPCYLYNCYCFTLLSESTFRQETEAVIYALPKATRLHWKNTHFTQNTELLVYRLLDWLFCLCNWFTLVNLNQPKSQNNRSRQKLCFLVDTPMYLSILWVFQTLTTVCNTLTTDKYLLQSPLQHITENYLQYVSVCVLCC